MRSTKKEAKKRSHTKAKLQRIDVRKSKPNRPRKRDAVFIEGDVLSVLKTFPEQSYDLIISSPPYNIGKAYERSPNLSFDEYIKWQDEVIGALIEKLADSGSICWQVGSYVKDGESYPLDVYFYDSFKKRGMQLRNRIVWKFNFGLHSTKRLSGRYETLLWFTKTENYKFNLDAIRVPQLYPGKRHPKGKRNGSGLPSGNPLGKNPGDYWEFSADQLFNTNPIWDIPNVKANHPEKTIHPCQFPVELVERCVLALTSEGDTILDPFVGTGTSVIAAIKHRRRGIGIDKDPTFINLAIERVSQFRIDKLKVRPIGKPVHKPKMTDKVARVPREWAGKRR